MSQTMIYSCQLLETPSTGFKTRLRRSNSEEISRGSRTNGQKAHSVEWNRDFINRFITSNVLALRFALKVRAVLLVAKSPSRPQNEFPGSKMKTSLISVQDYLEFQREKDLSSAFMESDLLFF